jgi:hypothetical protein
MNEYYVSKENMLWQTLQLNYTLLLPKRLSGNFNNLVRCFATKVSLTIISHGKNYFFILKKFLRLLGIHLLNIVLSTDLSPNSSHDKERYQVWWQ